MWEDVKIVHGKLRHGQSQDCGTSKCRCRGYVGYVDGRKQYYYTDWHSGLKFIQFQKNKALHSGKKKYLV